MATYDRSGVTYSLSRRTDLRIAAAIEGALHESASVANIGAGTGSYEPPQTVVAVEPSEVMIAQRGPNAAPAVRAIAEHLPIRSKAVDSALAVLTVHHWANLKRGLEELVRIAQRRVVIFTWDHRVFQEFWLVRDYLPAAARTDRRLAVPMERFGEVLGEVSISPVLVPHDCMDGFGAAFWRRPQAYLDDTVQAGMSLFALTPQAELTEGLERLRGDLADGSWAKRYASLLGETTFDAGYRLVVADLVSAQ
jgi:SAM-dependent methyltransferase